MGSVLAARRAATAETRRHDLSGTGIDRSTYPIYSPCMLYIVGIHSVGIQSMYAISHIYSRYIHSAPLGQRNQNTPTYLSGSWKLRVAGQVTSQPTTIHLQTVHQMAYGCLWYVYPYTSSRTSSEGMTGPSKPTSNTFLEGTTGSL